MNINQMRAFLYREVFKTTQEKKKVSKMPDDQVLAIFKSVQAREMKQKKNKDSEGEQLKLF